jgi:hypothetical protein
VRGNGIAVVVVVEEPAVAAGFAQGSLNRFEVHEADFSWQ